MVRTIALVIAMGTVRDWNRWPSPRAAAIVTVGAGSIAASASVISTVVAPTSFACARTRGRVKEGLRKPNASTTSCVPSPSRCSARSRPLPTSWTLSRPNLRKRRCMSSTRTTALPCPNRYTRRALAISWATSPILSWLTERSMADSASSSPVTSSARTVDWAACSRLAWTR